MATIDSLIKGAEIKEQYKKYIGRRVGFILVLLPVIALLIGISSSLGSADVSLRDVYTAIINKFFPGSFETSWLAEVCVWKLRLPRILMGILAGIGLGSAGCVMQGVLRNPLADPYMLGIASAAGFGASLAILFGTGVLGILGGKYLVIGNAFIFALLCSGIILGLSSKKGATPEAMILTGIAMMFLFSAMTTLLQYFAEAEAVKAAVFWMVGDLGKSSWEKLAIVAVVTAFSVPLLIWKSWDLNIMGSGDESAKSLGIKVEQTRIIIMVVSSLLVASIVCFTGTIGFVGLVAPHICRMVIGGDNRFLVPASALVGAVLLVLSDTVARTIMSPVILPVGVVTAFLGVPLFIYLIMRKRRTYW
jgi:iron complex transport system permease protein